MNSLSLSIIDPQGSKTIMWKLTADEVKELDDQCDGLVLKIGKITEILEMPPINIPGRRN